MGTVHFADHSANHIKMLSIHIDPRAARELDRYPGCSRDHRRKCRNEPGHRWNHRNLLEDSTPIRHTAAPALVPQLLAPFVE